MAPRSSVRSKKPAKARLPSGRAAMPPSPLRPAPLKLRAQRSCPCGLNRATNSERGLSPGLTSSVSASCSSNQKAPAQAISPEGRMARLVISSSCEPPALMAHSRSCPGPKTARKRSARPCDTACHPSMEIASSNAPPATTRPSGVARTALQLSFPAPSRGIAQPQSWACGAKGRQHSNMGHSFIGDLF